MLMVCLCARMFGRAAQVGESRVCTMASNDAACKPQRLSSCVCVSIATTIDTITTTTGIYTHFTPLCVAIAVAVFSLSRDVARARICQPLCPHLINHFCTRATHITMAPALARSARTETHARSVSTLRVNHVSVFYPHAAWCSVFQGAVYLRMKKCRCV